MPNPPGAGRVNYSMWSGCRFAFGLVFGIPMLGMLAFGQEPVNIDVDEVRNLRIGPPGAIHTKDRPGDLPFTQVSLQVVVDTEGRVESATTAQGPGLEQFFHEAETVEGSQRFKPFEKGGIPVRVSFTDYVSILPLEQWGPKAPFPEIKDWTSLKIRLERTACFGSCPDYSIEVNGDGEVDFNGISSVLVTGHHQSKVSKDVVKSLLATFRHADYFSLKDAYRMRVTDCPTFTAFLEFDGQKKSVVDYMGIHVGMPEAARDVEDAIDQAAGVDKWVKGNSTTGPALKAEKWDFRADTAENRALFANVVAHGSPQLIEFFVENGAPMHSRTKEGDTVLLNAAEKGNLELIELMVSASDPPPKALLSCALAPAAKSGNLELVQLLVDKGADPNAPPCSEYDKATVLMKAAQSGKPEMVEKLLKHNPDLDAQDQDGNAVLSFFMLHSPPSLNTQEIVNILIKAGAGVNHRDNMGGTPLFAASASGHPEAIRPLLDAGAEVNAENKNGETLLFSCFDNASLKLILDAGADLFIPNKEGETAAQAALKMGQTKKAELLETAMARQALKKK